MYAICNVKKKNWITKWIWSDQVPQYIILQITIHDVTTTLRYVLIA